MSARRSRFEPINLLYGLMMGTADIVPGVSGGTIALIVGIYERLIASIRAVASAAASLARGQRGEARRHTREAEWGFVLPLGFGIVTALLVGARLLEPLLEAYPVPFRSLFFGLIAASVAVPWKRIGQRIPRSYWIAAVAALVAFVIVGLPPQVVSDPGMLVIFLAASVAICAMILPGVSGSFLLLVMGLYEPTLAALNGLDLRFIGVFILGAAIGLGIFSKLLNHLLRNYHDATMAALVGLMIGSLRALWPYQDEARRLLPPPSGEELLSSLALAAIGFVLVVALVRFGLTMDEQRRRQTAPDVDTPESQV
ncbi:MAG: DUF368 domain-containing protein [Gemmatimonadota bacterium]